MDAMRSGLGRLHLGAVAVVFAWEAQEAVADEPKSSVGCEGSLKAAKVNPFVSFLGT